MRNSTALSRREREVAALVAQGMTNRQIAERLFIAERTAEGHVEQIRNKLGFSTRSQIAAWVASGTAGAATTPSQLPRAHTSLIGRSTEIQKVLGAIEDSRLVTITGPGGIGKTRLGIEVAARVQDRFRGRVWLAELAATPEGVSVAAAVAHALKLTQAGAASAEEQLVASLSTRDGLIVLDNCEHVVEACAKLVELLLSTSTRAWVLATSRESLGVLGERLIRLEPLSVVGEGPSRGDAVELFLQRCRDFGKETLTDDELVHAASICERLDGIPLAIELAAAQTAVLSMSDIELRLADRFDLLIGSVRTATPTQQTLKAAVEWSYQLLTPVEQAAFRRFSVFLGGFDVESAAALLESGGDVEDSTVSVVAALIRKSMLTVRDQSSGGRRYHMLETLRDFAHQRRDEAGETEDARRRQAQHFLQLAQTAFSNLRSAASDAWVRRLDAERENLNAALEFLGSGHNDDFVRMVAALGRYWIRGRLRDGYMWTARAMEIRRAAEPTNLDLLEAWAWLTWQCDLTGPAFEAIDEMVETATEREDDAHAGRALNMLATFRGDRGLPVDPESWAQAEAHLRKSGDAWSLALLLNDIGFVRLYSGEPGQGLPQILEGLELAHQVGDGWLIALVLDSAAWAHVDSGMVDEAVALWTEGIAKSLAAPDRWALPSHLEGFARVARLEADYERACMLLAAAAAVRSEIGAQPQAGWVQYLQPDFDLLRNQLGSARFDAAWAVGFGMPAEDAVVLAIGRAKSGAAQAPDPPPETISTT